MCKACAVDDGGDLESRRDALATAAMAQIYRISLLYLADGHDRCSLDDELAAPLQVFDDSADLWRHRVAVRVPDGAEMPKKSQTLGMRQQRPLWGVFGMRGTIPMALIEITTE